MYDEWYLIGLLVSNVFGYSVGEKAQRFYSVKNEKEATKVGNVATLLIMTGPILFGIPPLIARVLWPDISLMEFFQNIAKPDENVYIAVVLKYMPAGMVGIFLSAMMAASMSAMDSAWNTVSAIVSVDIFKTILHPKASRQAGAESGADYHDISLCDGHCPGTGHFKQFGGYFYVLNDLFLLWWGYRFLFHYLLA